MKKMLWLLLAALPVQAAANVEDPIAYKCYMCTDDERVAVALGRGVGEHYVYNAANTRKLWAYRVALEGNTLVAEEFAPANWITYQYEKFMSMYKEDRGEFVDAYGTVALQPPGSPHVRSDLRLWGHHVSGLNPDHEQAREIALRSITARASYLAGDPEHGRLLRFEPQLRGDAPLIARFNILHTYLGFIEFFFNYDTRRWEYLESGDQYNRMQERPEDFLSADGGPRSFRYPYTYDQLQPYFVQRAEWAGVNIIGELPVRADVTFNCSRVNEQTQCRID
jgi:hypothetical protein